METRCTQCCPALALLRIIQILSLCLSSKLDNSASTILYLLKPKTKKKEEKKKDIECTPMAEPRVEWGHFGTRNSRADLARQ